MELYRWIKMHRHLHLTLGEVTSLPKNKPLSVIILDRNFEEMGIWDQIPKKKSIPPKEMFQGNRAEVKYLGLTKPSKGKKEHCPDGDTGGSPKWEIAFSWGETIQETLHLNLSNLNTNWNWIPIEDGRVTIDSEVIVSGEEPPKEQFKEFHSSWKQFHPRNRVGWRGPVIRWSDLEQLEEVYWESP